MASSWHSLPVYSHHCIRNWLDVTSKFVQIISCCINHVVNKWMTPNVFICVYYCKCSTDILIVLIALIVHIFIFSSITLSGVPWKTSLCQKNTLWYKPVNSLPHTIYSFHFFSLFHNMISFLWSRIGVIASYSPVFLFRSIPCVMHTMQLVVFLGKVKMTFLGFWGIVDFEFWCWWRSLLWGSVKVDVRVLDVKRGWLRNSQLPAGCCKWLCFCAGDNG